MYAKLTNNKLTYAPRNYNNGENLILNFNKNTILMEKYGYKEVVDIKPEYDSSTHYLSIDGYTENEDSITVNYKLNEIVIDDTPTLEEKLETLQQENRELQVINQIQDELINTTILATDEMYTLLEPLLVDTLSVRGVNAIVNMYVAMVQRGLKQKEDVPERYREEVISILDSLENN